MLDFKIVPAKMRAYQESKQKEKENQSSKSNQGSMAILANIFITKKKEKFADHGTKTKFVICVFLHSQKEWVRLVTAGMAPSCFFSTLMKEATSRASRSCPPLSAVISSHGVDYENTLV